MLSTAPDEGTLIVRGDGPADLEQGRLKDVGDVETTDPGLNSKLTTESARGIADDMVAAKLGDGEVCRVKGLAAVRRDVDSYPLREGGLGTAMLLKVGVLPLELGAGNRPCLGGRVGTISPTSSNRSSPAVGVTTVP